MTNLFLKVDKDLFNKGLNPTEILVLAQITEFNTNTGDCFISDEALANQFGVSAKTISRTIAALEEKGLIIKETKNVKGGKERHIKIPQRTICPLTTDNLSIDKGQIYSIKDNIKDNIKDKISEEIPKEEKIDYKKEAIHSLTNSDGSFKM